ncbi:MAG: hypothetical protein JWR60_1532 [Polaromonas sp.]|nr:hypothetical protein [Polaromonas sp.]
MKATPCRIFLKSTAALGLMAGLAAAFSLLAVAWKCMAARSVKRIQSIDLV